MGIDFRRPRHIRGFRLGEVLIFGPGIGKILVEKTVSGAVASFSDAEAGYPLVNLEAAIVPKQASGTPTPTNPLPISGFSYGVLKQVGKNLIVAPTYATNTDSLCLDLGEDKTVNSVTMSFLAVNSVVDNISSAVVDFRESNGTHHYKTLNDFKKNNVSFQPSTQNNGMFSCTISNITFRYVYISYTSSNRSKFASDSIAEWQVEVGSSATTYEAPTTPTTDTASFGQTVYGGAWKASQGKVVVTHRKQIYKGDDLTSVSLTYGQTAAGYTHLYFAIDGVPVANNPTETNTKSNMAVWGNASGAAIPSTECFKVINAGTNPRPVVYWYVNQTWQDVNAFKSWLNSNPFEVWYELATPTEISVESVNFTAREGVNNVFANTGNVTVKYYADANP